MYFEGNGHVGSLEFRFASRSQGSPRLTLIRAFYHDVQEACRIDWLAFVALDCSLQK